MSSSANKLVCLAVLAAWIGGCVSEPKPHVEFDLSVLDRVPVFPLTGTLADTPRAVCTGLLLPDGTILTCSHGLTREKTQGYGYFAGYPIKYRVLRSGDQLRAMWLSPDPAHPPEATGDWALLSSDPRIRSRYVSEGFVDVPLSDRPPSPGETLFVVGYTLTDADEYYDRVWAPVLVVARPGEDSVWLKGLVPEDLRKISRYSGRPAGAGRPGMQQKGLSGSPVIRRSPDGRLEACGLWIAGQFDEDGRARIGVAIPIPSQLLHPPIGTEEPVSWRSNDTLTPVAQ